MARADDLGTIKSILKKKFRAMRVTYVRYVRYVYFYVLCNFIISEERVLLRRVRVGAAGRREHVPQRRPGP